MSAGPLMLALANRRRELGLSQRQLSARPGIHHSTISQWEAGKVQPRPDSLRRLAVALGFDLGDGATEVGS